MCIVNPFDLYLKKNHTNLSFNWRIRIKKWGGGGYYYEINVFSSNTCWTKLLVPLGILMSKIYLKCIPIHVHNFEHSRVIMNNNKIIQPWLHVSHK